MKENHRNGATLSVCAKKDFFYPAWCIMWFSGPGTRLTQSFPFFRLTGISAHTLPVRSKCINILSTLPPPNQAPKSLALFTFVHLQQSAHLRLQVLSFVNLFLENRYSIFAHSIPRHVDKPNIVLPMGLVAEKLNKLSISATGRTQGNELCRET